MSEHDSSQPEMSQSGFISDLSTPLYSAWSLRAWNRLRRTHYAYGGQTPRRLRRRSANAYLIPELIHFKCCFLPWIGFQMRRSARRCGTLRVAPRLLLWLPLLLPVFVPSVLVLLAILLT